MLRVNSAKDLRLEECMTSKAEILRYAQDDDPEYYFWPSDLRYCASPNPDE